MLEILQGKEIFLVAFLLVAVLYFLVIVPQRRERKMEEQFLANLKVGDRVITVGGIHGTIVEVYPGQVILQMHSGNALCMFETHSISREMTSKKYGEEPEKQKRPVTKKKKAK